MKKLILIAIAVLFFSAMANAGQLDGVYFIGNCSVMFSADAKPDPHTLNNSTTDFIALLGYQLTETGTATLVCGKSVAQYDYQYSPPWLVVLVPNSWDLPFVKSGDTLYYLDPAGVTLKK